jgi:uncharacterized protein with ParB-like and HNH nuclease domain
VEGLEGLIPPNREPEKLILDGQQRLTTLTQALSLAEPVNTQTAMGKQVNLAREQEEYEMAEAESFAD